MQVALPARLGNQGFDFVPQKPKPGVAVHVAFPVLQVARPDSHNDLLLGQTKLLPGRLVA